MNYSIKVVSRKKYKLKEYEYGSRIQYAQIALGKQDYMGIVNLDRQDEIFLVVYFADKILTELAANSVQNT